MEIFRIIKSISILILSFYFVAAGYSENTGNHDKEKKHDAKSYEVVIGILPIDVNPEALTRPYCQVLEIQNENGTQRLMSLSYPVRKTFVWSPDTGRGVVLKIEIGDLKLEKKYTGRLGFPEFLKDFKDGKRVFKAEEFKPYETKVLEEYGVEYILVNLYVRGADPVIKFLDR